MTEKNEQNSEIQHLLEEIREQTGVPFTIPESDRKDPGLSERLTSILRSLSDSEKRETQSRGDLLLAYVQGQLSGEEIRSLRSHVLFTNLVSITPFLISFDRPLSENKEAVPILSEFLDPSSTEFLHAGPNDLLILPFSEHARSEAETVETALQLVDTLSSEAMSSVRIAFDRSADFDLLPQVTENLFTAMKIGKIFFANERVYNFHDLGLGKLIAGIPTDVCRTFLKESLPGVDFRNLDKETRSIIDGFFASGLNIAEASRSLYLHRNTLAYRLDKFHKQTGLDLRNFEDAVTIKIGLLISEYLDTKEKAGEDAQ